MSTTPHLEITELGENQASPDVTVNTALGVVDCAVQLSVIDMTTTSPPGGESDGDRYIIASVASGDWTSLEGQIACYIGTAYHYLDPGEGWTVYDVDTNSYYMWDGVDTWIRTGGQGDLFDSSDVTTTENLDFEIEREYWNLTGNVTLSITNAPPSGQVRIKELWVDLNTHTITWPTGSPPPIDWGAAGAPTQTSNKVLWIRFMANDSLTYGALMGTFDP